MALFKLIQWLLGLAVTFYVFKGLLGKFQEGDLTKALVVFTAAIGLALFTNGVIRIG